jgi:death-on-curing protein
MENIAVYVADNKIDKGLLQEIVSSILIEDNFNEELKLKIIDALSE